MRRHIFLFLSFMQLITYQIHRAAIVGDEVNTVLDHFDFSNFDREESLNTLDMQKMENRVRGKKGENYGQLSRSNPVPSCENQQSEELPTDNIENLVNNMERMLTQPDKKTRKNRKLKNHLKCMQELKQENWGIATPLLIYWPQRPPVRAKNRNTANPVWNNYYLLGKHWNHMKLHPDRSETMCDLDQETGESHHDKANVQEPDDYKEIIHERMESEQNNDGIGGTGEIGVVNKDENEPKSNEVQETSTENVKQQAEALDHGVLWDNWSAWSPCSVTCGLGKEVRWRHCIDNKCHKGELEINEKGCQRPACNPISNLLHIFERRKKS